jgi:hypothetical protein
VPHSREHRLLQCGHHCEAARSRGVLGTAWGAARLGVYLQVANSVPGGTANGRASTAGSLAILRVHLCSTFDCEHPAGGAAAHACNCMHRPVHALCSAHSSKATRRLQLSPSNSCLCTLCKL